GRLQRKPRPKTNAANKGRRSQSENVRLPRGLFQQPLLKLLLALNAMPRPGHCLQPLGVNLFTAADALAEATLADARKRFVDHLQELALVVALAEQKFLGIGARRAVGNVLCCVFIRGAAVGLRAVDRAP